MDLAWKALLTATMVLLVLAAARRAGPRLAGAVAALPTITAPTLAWLAHEHGAASAVDAAVASVAACAMLALFALAYARAAKHVGRTSALTCGVVAGTAMAVPA